jgi:hypothetical protein
MAKLPNGHLAIVPESKLTDYCLSEAHWESQGHSGRTSELGVVALTVDLPGQGLQVGQVGTVVFVLAPDSFEVEFVDQQGKTYALCTVTLDQLMVLKFKPQQAA